MKIGFFVDVFYPMIDGVIKVVDNYATLLAEKGEDVTVFCPNGKEKFDDSKFPYKVVRCESLYIEKYDYVVPMPSFDAKLWFCGSASIAVSELHRINALHTPFSALPILVTLAGIVTRVRLVQLANADMPIDVTLSGMVTALKPVHPAKAP